MALELVGGALLSSSLQFLFERIGSEEVLAYLRGKFKRGNSDDLIGKLKIVLNSVLTVIEDAEQKQIRSKGVEEWLDMLQEAVFDAEDLLDSIETDAHLHKQEAESSKRSTLSMKKKKLRNFFSRAGKSDNGDMESKVKKLLERLEFISNQKDLLGLEKCERKNSSWRPPTTSLVDESGVFGRESDKAEMINLLVSNVESREKISVIPIVGIGGIGKTTLAKALYNDRNVTEHFELKAWVCVSDEFDVCKVTKALLEEVTSNACSVEGLNLLQLKLKEILMGKKFLIVLDDVWSENSADWSDMSMPFKDGAQGSKIIVTTRSKNVASIMGTSQIHHLEILSDEACWELFVKEASGINGDFSALEDLKKIGQEIVKKCKGLPLALKTLGGLLRSTREVWGWKRILDSEIWDLREDESKILPALKLSYHYLPPQLKQCFAYCSIFPKDYEFKKEELVLLWMAENLLERPNNKKRCIEDVGDEYFHGLVSRSFFQLSSTNKSIFVMHDLIHDLAKSVSAEFCSHLEGETTGELNVKKLRHLAYIAAYKDPYGRFSKVLNATNLRTFLPIEEGHWRMISVRLIAHLAMNLRCLRALSVSGYRNVNCLPDSIGELLHLRYLDLSHTGIIKLPESVCKLINLQTLKLTSCWNLKRLPKNFHLLINLRFLDTRDCRSLVEMPTQISKLKNLQTVSAFIVGKDNGAKIGELRELSNLRGELCIKKLENVGNVKATQDQANLMDKKHLESLMLEWSEDNNGNRDQARDVLDMLSPNRNLKELQISKYPGKEFPNWLGSHLLGNINSIRLSKCRNCSSLPPLGQLPSLKSLEISNFDALVTVGPEFYGSGLGAKPFPSLEILKFLYMSSWESWSNEDCSTFAVLRELEIISCPKLTGDLPCSLTSLAKFKLVECEKLSFSLSRCPSVRELILHGCQNISLFSCSSQISIPIGCLPANLKKLVITDYLVLAFEFNFPHKSLEELCIIRSCITFITFPLNYFPNIKKLCFQNLEKLESLSMSDGLCKDMTSLSSLRISKNPSFISFPKDGLPAPNLTELTIDYCKKLKYFPEKMHNLISSLKHLRIDNCPEIELFPEASLPDSLYEIFISNCYKLTITLKSCHLKKLLNLRRFILYDDMEATESFLKEGPLPSTITDLSLWSFPCLKSLQKLTSLEKLSLSYLAELHTIPGHVLPNSIKYLDIYDCDELQTISEGLPIALEYLIIKICPMLQKIPSELPGSLKELFIYDCPELQKMPSELPGSLKELRIYNCPTLQTMPEKPLPMSLQKLIIIECPLLANKCRREKGKYWNNIAHIYYIEIDGEIIS